MGGSIRGECVGMKREPGRRCALPPAWKGGVGEGKYDWALRAAAKRQWGIPCPLPAFLAIAE
jgi:hypothetical protein